MLYKRMRGVMFMKSIKTMFIVFVSVITLFIFTAQAVFTTLQFSNTAAKEVQVSLIN